MNSSLMALFILPPMPELISIDLEYDVKLVIAYDLRKKRYFVKLWP